MSYSMDNLIGKTPVEITSDEYEIRFLMSDGTRYRLFHMQDCCEDVSIEDINGNLTDLLHRPIIESSERSQDNPKACESGTWTFFHIGNIYHTIVIRFYGQSNGYYSESADLWECDSDWTEKW